MNFFIESIPTKRQLIKRYGSDVFPYGKKDDCCGDSQYLMDFITHRMLYHKISLRETLEELDEFMFEIRKESMEKN